MAVWYRFWATTQLAGYDPCEEFLYVCYDAPPKQAVLEERADIFSTAVARRGEPGAKLEYGWEGPKEKLDPEVKRFLVRQAFDLSREWDAQRKFIEEYG